MDTHIKILGWLHVIFGALGVLMGLLGLAFFGGIAGMIGMSGPTGDEAVAIPIMGAIGGFVMLLALIISVPGLIVGWGLINYKSWARILGIILSALHLINVPFGTVLGIYGLWVLLNDQTRALLEGGVRPAVTHPGPAGPPYRT
jgi:hypothetical protein